MKVKTLSLALLASASSALAQTSIVDYQFNDTNGAYLGGTNASQIQDAGTIKGSWNNGVQARVQSGKLNYGYTANWRGSTGTTLYVDQGAGTRGHREYTLTSGLTNTSYSTYTFEIVIPTFDIRQNWDSSNTSDAGKGIQFTLRNLAQTEEVVVGYQTTSGGGVQAFNNSEGGSFGGLNGSAFDTDNDANTKTPSRFGGSNNPGISLKITGDLTDGSWTAYAGDTNHGYSVIQSGTGLSDIASMRIAAKSPSLGSWGGVAGGPWTTDPITSGDYFNIDSLTLTANAIVPEPQTISLIAGVLALGYVMIRRRK